MALVAESSPSSVNMLELCESATLGWVSNRLEVGCDWEAEWWPQPPHRRRSRRPSRCRLGRPCGYSARCLWQLSTFRPFGALRLSWACVVSTPHSHLLAWPVPAAHMARRRGRILLHRCGCRFVRRLPRFRRLPALRLGLALARRSGLRLRVAEAVAGLSSAVPAGGHPLPFGPAIEGAVDAREGVVHPLSLQLSSWQP